MKSKMYKVILGLRPDYYDDYITRNGTDWEDADLEYDLKAELRGHIRKYIDTKMEEDRVAGIKNPIGLSCTLSLQFMMEPMKHGDPLSGGDRVHVIEFAPNSAFVKTDEDMKLYEERVIELVKLLKKEYEQTTVSITVIPVDNYII